jgi:hypothetical protein
MPVFCAQVPKLNLNKLNPFQVKRVMPVSLRKYLNVLNPRTPYFTEEASSGRRGGDEGLLTRPPATESNRLW